MNKIRNSGIYLIDLKGNVNPEFGMKHYCVLVNTIDRDLFLAFPTTTSIKRRKEAGTYILKIDNSVVLFKHTRIISRNRIIGESVKNGILNVWDEFELDSLMKEYEDFILDMHRHAMKSVKQYHNAKEASFNSLKLECKERIELSVGESIRYDEMVIYYQGGKVVHNEISTKESGVKQITFSVKDKYNQKITKIVEVVINEQTDNYDAESK